MVIKITPDLETALSQQAQRQGLSPEELAVSALRERFLPPAAPLSHDDWMRLLLSAGSDCGVSLSNSALSREELYD